MITAIYEDRDKDGQYVFKGPNCRYAESILDRLRVYHNPFAAHPLPLNLFERPEIFQATSNRPVSLLLVNECKRNLVNRSAMSFPAGFMKKVLETMRPDQNFWWHAK